MKKVAEEMRVRAAECIRIVMHVGVCNHYSPSSTIIVFQILSYILCNSQDWYGDRVGVVYVVHMNVLFWILFTVSTLLRISTVTAVSFDRY